jgi:serine/threonine protein phosphatase PrpC
MKVIYVLEDQGSRQYMEDRNYVEKNFFLDYDMYAVYDGHSNDLLSKLLHLYFKDILRNELFLDENISVALSKACDKMNDIIPKDIGMSSGSTALIVLNNDKELWVINIGDCRAIINRNTEALQITIDHKPTLKSEYDRIISVGGFVSADPFGTLRVNGNLSLSRAFGDFSLFPAVTYKPDIYHYNLFPECKFIFLASDGVYDTVNNEEIVKLLNDELKIVEKLNTEIVIKLAISNACNNILRLARSRGSGDNITIIVSLRPSA